LENLALRQQLAVNRSRVKGMDIQEVPIAPQSPWQNPYSELDWLYPAGVLGPCDRAGENHLRRILQCYFTYYGQTRTLAWLRMLGPFGRYNHPRWETSSNCPTSVAYIIARNGVQHNTRKPSPSPPRSPSIRAGDRAKTVLISHVQTKGLLRRRAILRFIRRENIAAEGCPSFLTSTQEQIPASTCIWRSTPSVIMPSIPNYLSSRGGSPQATAAEALSATSWDWE
jgi:hypothetical protein